MEDEGKGLDEEVEVEEAEAPKVRSGEVQPSKG